MSARTPLPFHEDPALLLQACARLVSERIVADLARSGLADLRESDGYVFQHLQSGPRTVSDLAGKLGITQQGASKAVADLARRGYVAIEPDPDDRRARAVSLTERGWKAIRRGRTSRERFARDIERAVGAAQAAEIQRSLVAVTELLGGFEVLGQRNLRPAP